MRVAVLVAGMCLALHIASAQSINIDFEKFPGADAVIGTSDDVPSGSTAVPLTTQYAGVGVTFLQATVQTTTWPGTGAPTRYWHSDQRLTTAFFSKPVRYVSLDVITVNGPVVLKGYVGNDVVESEMTPNIQAGVAFTLRLTTLAFLTSITVERTSCDEPSDCAVRVDNMRLDDGVNFGPGVAAPSGSYPIELTAGTRLFIAGKVVSGSTGSLALTGPGLSAQSVRSGITGRLLTLPELANTTVAVPATGMYTIVAEGLDSVEYGLLANDCQPIFRSKTPSFTFFGSRGTSVYLAHDRGCVLPVHSGAGWLQVPESFTILSGQPDVVGTIDAQNFGARPSTVVAVGNVLVPVEVRNTQNNCPLEPYYTPENFNVTGRKLNWLSGGCPYSQTQAGRAGTRRQRSVEALYYGFFGRLPSHPERDAWDKTGLPLRDIALAFLNSPEFAAGSKTVAAAYLLVFDRDIKLHEWSFQRNAIRSGAITRTAFLQAMTNTTEYWTRGSTMNNHTFAGLLYEAVLGRVPSTAEADLQDSALASGVTRPTLANHFLDSPEFRVSNYPRLTASLLYFTLLGRDGSENDRWALSRVIASGNLAGAVEAMINSPEFALIVAE